MDLNAVMVVEAAKVPMLMEEMGLGTEGGAPKSYTQNEMDLYLPIYNSASLAFHLCLFPCLTRRRLPGGIISYIHTHKEKKTAKLRPK